MSVPTNLIPSPITGLPEYMGSSTLGYLPYVLEGRSYKVQFANIAAVGAVPSSRVIAAGTGLTGGGDLSANRVIAIAAGGVGFDQLALSGVVAGTYGSGSDIPVLTVDSKGRVTSATTVALNVTGFVPTSRTITAGDGLTGGGALTSNITLAANFSATTPSALGIASAGTSVAASRGDHVHPAVNLSDTTQTQGALPLGRGGTGDALSPVAGAVVYSTGTKFALTNPGLVGQVLVSNGTDEPQWQTIAGAGTVTSVNASGGTTGLSFTGGPITSAGTLTLGGTLGVANGGTGATDAATALTNLGAYPASNPAGYTSNVGTVTSVNLTAGTGISVSGGPVTSSGSINVVNTAPDQIVSLTGAGTTVVTGTYPNFTITSNDQYSGTVTSVAASGGTTGLTFTGGPITTSGTLTLGGTLAVANGGTGATTASGARTNLGAAASGANSDITSLSGITGSISTVDSITFDTAAGVTVGAGQMAWNVDDGTLNIGMGYDAVTQQVGLEQYYRIKASAAITDGQCVMYTGAVGASGVLTGAPATGVTNPQYIMGVATMDIANNGFGYITSFGLVRAINTTGSSVGETWVDGDVLYYNPAYTGGLTKVPPTAPTPKVVVATVVNAAGGGAGSLFIRVQGEPDLHNLSDVYAPSPISNGQILIGDGPQSRWEAATLTAGTNVSITNAAGAITINATDQYTGTVTSVAASGGTTGLTFSGSPITTSGTLTLGGTLAVSNGGTGATSLTANNVLLGNGTSAVQVVAPGTSGNVLTSNGTTWTSSAPAGGTVSYPQNAQNGNYTLVLSDAGKHIYSANTGAQTITIPTNASVAFPIGTLVTIVNMGTTKILLSASGVSIIPVGSTTALSAPVVTSGMSVQLLKTGTNTWNAIFGTVVTNTVTASYLVIAGGASGGRSNGGGGGAGGYLESTATLTAGATYTVTVGAGGASASGTQQGNDGSNSVLSGTGVSVTSTGGGGGGTQNGTNAGRNGGSGGGGSYFSGAGGSPTSGQGFAGGTGSGGSGNGGGGGGASAAGVNADAGSNQGNGGAGTASSITGTSVTRAGGGGAGGLDRRGLGGAGGGGNGAHTLDAVAGTANTGGGGGGGSSGLGTNSGAGGSGVVILSIPTADYTGTTTGSPTVTTSGSNTILTFTSSGSYTA